MRGSVARSRPGAGERDGATAAGAGWRRRAAATTLLLAGLLAVLVATLLSSADARLAQRSERSSEIGPRGEGSARANCPRGARRHPISGGFANDSPWRADLNSTITATVSKPAGRRGWKLKAANFAGERETVTASVLCSKRNPRARTRKDEVDVAPGEEAKATARCRRREEAIAGGFKAPRFAQDRGPEVVAVASRRKGRRKWRVVAYNNSAQKQGKLVAYARCAKRRPRLEVVRERGTAVDQAPVELAPRCGKGSLAWSGGFIADFQSFDPFAAIVADRSYADGRRWRTRFVGFQTTGEVKAIAYCGPKR